MWGQTPGMVPWLSLSAEVSLALVGLAYVLLRRLGRPARRGHAGEIARFERGE